MDLARIGRLVVKNEQAVYHVMSRTALDGYPLGDIEKEFLVDVIRKKSKHYFVDIPGFCIMGNHFHLLARMLPETGFTDEDIRERFGSYAGNSDMVPTDEDISRFRVKWGNVSEFTREIKLELARYYNKRHNRRGYFWGVRFKSVLVENGETLINCLAYIDLNPIRAGLVERPEDYRWCSLAYHVQTDNKDNFLSLDFGLREFGHMDASSRLQYYRRYVYEAGAIPRPDKPAAKTIDGAIVENERSREFNLDRIQRFRYRTRYFTDSGIIGTKAFVAAQYQHFKNLFPSKSERTPKPVTGLTGMFSLKRLSSPFPLK